MRVTFLFFHTVSLPIHDPSSDLASMISSDSNCGNSMALNPKTVPILKDASPETIQAAIY